MKEKEVIEFVKKRYKDPDTGLICGIDCDCDDSCLEFFCECGYSWSSSRIEPCAGCGKYLMPS